MRDQEIRKKILITKESLSEKEIEALVYNNVVGFHIEYEEKGNKDDTGTDMYTIVKCIDDNNQERLFEISWLKGLTDIHESYYWTQPTEVNKIVQIKHITETTYVPIKKENND